MSQNKKESILDVQILPTELIELEEYPETHTCGYDISQSLNVS